MLLPRILTAVVGIPLLLCLIHVGSVPFALFTVAVAVLALYEYALLLWMGGRGIQRWTTCVGGGILALTTALGAPASGEQFRGGLGGLVITGLLLFVVLRELFRKDHSLDRAALTLFGIFFIGWTLAHLALLRDLRPGGERFTFLLFVTIWIMDTAAYAVGKTLGKHKLAAVISPGKTWEGAVGGFAAALATVAAARYFFLKDVLGPLGALAIGTLIGSVGQLSDLAESVIKRAVGAKDSSALLPGHGGVLDRFDSFLLAAPMMYYILSLKAP